MNLKEQIEKVLLNVEKIPAEYWQQLEHFPNKKVIWFVDRQKPSVEANYDFDEERFGVTSDKEIVWGFDSGCSCPIPWVEHECYHITKEWKEFILSKPERELESWENEWFDPDWQDEANKNLLPILSFLDQS